MPDSRARRAADRTQIKRVTSAKQVKQVEQWFARMSLHLDRAVALAQDLDGENLSQDDDLFWALVKYAENVQECIVQLDNMSRSILQCLVEFPLKSDNGGTNWSDLKGMRGRLAHHFWDIDAAVLWDTVMNDFIQLNQILHSLRISTTIGDIEDQPSGVVRTADLLKLAPTEGGARVGLGNSLPFLYFDSDGLAQCLRLGRTSDNKILLAHSKPGEVSFSVGAIGEMPQQ